MKKNTNNSRSSVLAPDLAGGAAAVPMLVTAKQAAVMLSISERKLWSLTASHGITPVRIGRAVRYDISDLHAWIEAHKVREQGT